MTACVPDARSDKTACDPPVKKLCCYVDTTPQNRDPGGCEGAQILPDIYCSGGGTWTCCDTKKGPVRLPTSICGARVHVEDRYCDVDEVCCLTQTRLTMLPREDCHEIYRAPTRFCQKDFDPRCCQDADGAHSFQDRVECIRNGGLPLKDIRSCMRCCETPRGPRLVPIPNCPDATALDAEDCR